MHIGPILIMPHAIAMHVDFSPVFTIPASRWLKSFSAHISTSSLIGVFFCAYYFIHCTVFRLKHTSVKIAKRAFHRYYHDYMTLVGPVRVKTSNILWRDSHFHYNSFSWINVTPSLDYLCPTPIPHFPCQQEIYYAMYYMDT